jgi:hypothetical protein
VPLTIVADLTDLFEVVVPEGKSAKRVCQMLVE